MKIREGFVSNSSSSSFICRVNMDTNEAKEILIKLLALYNGAMDTNYIYEKVFYDPYVGDKKYENELNKYYGTYQTIPKINGSLVINSASDNSIPYELFNMIESKFNATRIHLG